MSDTNPHGDFPQHLQMSPNSRKPTDDFLGIFDQIPDAWLFPFQEEDDFRPDLDRARGGLVQEPPVDENSSDQGTENLPSVEDGSLAYPNGLSSFSYSSPTEQTTIFGTGWLMPAVVPAPSALGILSGQPLITQASGSKAQPFIIPESSSPNRQGISSNSPSTPTPNGGPVGLSSSPNKSTVSPAVKQLLTNKLHHRVAGSELTPSTTPVKGTKDKLKPTSAAKTPSLETSVTSPLKAESTELLRDEREEKRRERGRLHARTTRRRARERMDGLKMKNEELEAIQDIYKKCISILYKDLHGRYPNFTNQKKEWYRTPDGKEGPIVVNCLLPSTDPTFLLELGNNPGSGYLNYKSPGNPVGQPTLGKTGGSKASKRLKMDVDTKPAPNQIHEGNVPKLDEISTASGSGLFTAPKANISSSVQKAMPTSTSVPHHVAIPPNPIKAEVVSPAPSTPQAKGEVILPENSASKSTPLDSLDDVLKHMYSEDNKDVYAIINVNGVEHRFPVMALSNGKGKAIPAGHSTGQPSTSLPAIIASKAPRFVLTNPTRARTTPVRPTHSVPASTVVSPTPLAKSLPVMSPVSHTHHRRPQMSTSEGFISTSAPPSASAIVVMKPPDGLFKELESEVFSTMEDAGELSELNLSSLDFETCLDTEMDEVE